MLKITPVSKEEFNEILNILTVPEYTNRDYLFDLYQMVVEGIQNIDDTNILNKVSGVNHLELIQYLAGEYIYSTLGMPVEVRQDFEGKEQYKEQMSAVAADKYLSLSFFSHKERKLTNRFFPPMSSLDLYVNFMLNIVQNYKKNDPKISLVADLLNKSLSITRCIINLLVSGYETEAFASWRTLHECECSLVILDKYKDVAIDAYLKHMQYGLAFKNVIPSKETTDEIFAHLKNEMKTYDLKSKDMKKYIEYGWLTSVADFKDNPDLKFNFRDGLEKLAGLHDYSERYMESSEILHSTPLLIYSNKQYFYYLTLLSTYESFFRLESVFVSLFASQTSPEASEKYKELRRVYFSQLISIHKKETNAFISWQKSLKNNNK